MRIKIIATLLFSSIFLFGSARAHAADAQINIVVFGDSLTSGYQLQPAEAFPVKLQKKLEEIGFQDIQIINMSQSEDTSADGIDRLHDVMLKRPDVVVLAYGLNDTMRGIDPAIIYKNIAFMAGQLKQERVYTVLMGIRGPSNLGAEYNQNLNAYFTSIANYYKLPFYPDALTGIAEQPKYTVADGYRPNAQGVDIMVEGMYRLVDAGVRWRIEVLKYQEEYRKSQQPVQ